MVLKTLKLLTVLSFCYIQVRGEHLGAPMIVFLFLGLLSKFKLTMVGVILIWMALFSILISLTRSKNDRIVIPIALVILIVPIIIQFVNIFGHVKEVNETPFYLTVALFVALATATATMVLKKQKIYRKI
jgi:hypothetical protein